LASPSEETSERIDRAETQLERTLEELGRLARGLHPRELSEVGLKGALAALAERSSIPVAIAFACDGLPPEEEVAVYFVCSEALANVTKYAAASRVAMSVTSDQNLIRVQIEDDGIGGADPAKGSGLRGLADRVETLGGTLHVDSPSGQGTHIAAEIPLVPEER
jgi:signal transduction histidine kinase